VGVTLYLELDSFRSMNVPDNRVSLFSGSCRFSKLGLEEIANQSGLDIP
jgi:hypothetical protein